MRLLFISDINAVHARRWASEMVFYVQILDVVQCLR